MINIHVPKLYTVQSRPALLLNQSKQSINIPLIPKIDLTNLKPPQKTFPSQIIMVKKTEFQKLKQTLEWRTKTQFPILKIKNWKILSEKNIQSQIHLQIFIELDGSFKSLDDIQKISFTQSVYILKESLIGFERLCYHFGIFQVESNMIKFNQYGICKVWLSANCFSNQINLIKTKSQKHFITQLCQIIKAKTKKFSNSKYFFQNIQKTQYFFEAIGVIDTFTRENIINVPNSIQNIEERKSPLIKFSLNLDPLQQRSKQNQPIKNPIPAFLKKNQCERKNSNETSIPLTKKIKMLKNSETLDRSLTDIIKNTNASNLAKNQSSNKIINQQENCQTTAFCQGPHIRLIQPKQKKRNDFPSLQYISSKFKKLQSNQSLKINFLGDDSELTSTQAKESKLSMNAINSKKKQNHQKKGTQITEQRGKPKKFGSFPQKHEYLQNYSRFSKQLRTKHQIHEDFEHLEEDSNKYSFKIKNFKEKRKFSSDIGNISGKLKQKSVDNQDRKFANFLNVPKNIKNKNGLTKSPSHQVISLSPKIIHQQFDENEKSFLREKLMIGSQWNLNKLGDKLKAQKEHLQETKQTARQEKTKTSQIKKLASMGRQVNENSETQQVQFELEYGKKIENQKSIRKQILNVLD